MITIYADEKEREYESSDATVGFVLKDQNMVSIIYFNDDEKDYVEKEAMKEIEKIIKDDEVLNIMLCKEKRMMNFRGKNAKTQEELELEDEANTSVTGEV